MTTLCKKINLHFFLSLLLLLLQTPSFSLNTDGVLLLSFKYSILSDPLSVLQSWNYLDETPCSWAGVTCTEIGKPGTPDMFRVTSLVLPNSQLLGSISSDLGFIKHLQSLDLSNNFFNGSLPNSILNSSELQFLSLASNKISGELPELVGSMTSLQLLNLSDNALAGKVPQNLTALQNLTVLSLRSNYFSGSVPSRLNSVEILDLSSNLLNGSLPRDFGGVNLRYLNVSYNKISGLISPEFAERIPENATIDLSFNDLTGAIPQSVSLLNQKINSFSGNVELCGKPLRTLCSIPSTLSTPPNVTGTTSPAIAVIPKTFDTDPKSNTSQTQTQTQATHQPQSSLKPGTIAAIVVADLAGLAILGMIILYVYQLRKRTKPNETNCKTHINKNPETVLKFDPESRNPPAPWSCLTVKNGQESSEATSSSDTDDHDGAGKGAENGKGGTLVTVDGETELELETLLKASAYILGASGGSIVYKAVLEDGTALAVRRIGDCGIERLKDFESQVRAIAKLKHPNLVKVRGFYWGNDEKLVIYDFVSNGSLASSSYRKQGSSPYHLPLDVRLKIARGVARGLAYIHEKKHVHGNIKPSNILLTSDMDPIISDFGLDRLLSATASAHQASHSSRHFLSGSHRCTATPEPPTFGSSPAATSSMSLYQAPESLKNIKPNPKWDVYAFGVLLLELLTGRALSDRELSYQRTGGLEEKYRVLKMVDVAIRADVEGKEDAMLACFKLGFSCACFMAQKRPSMKEALQVIEKMMPCSL